jgi:hypothetical protein
VKHVVTIAFVAVALLHLYPAVGVLGAARLEALYGLPIATAELELLLRHRAVLFGLLGALLLAAAWHAPLRGVALVAGMVSMGSYVALALPLDAHGPAIARVFWADVIGIGVLAAAGALRSGGSNAPR